MHESVESLPVVFYLGGDVFVLQHHASHPTLAPLWGHTHTEVSHKECHLSWAQWAGSGIVCFKCIWNHRCMCSRHTSALNRACGQSVMFWRVQLVPLQSWNGAEITPDFLMAQNKLLKHLFSNLIYHFRRRNVNLKASPRALSSHITQISRYQRQALLYGSLHVHSSRRLGLTRILIKHYTRTISRCICRKACTL